MKKEPKSFQPPAPTLNYFNPVVAKKIASRERKIKVIRVITIIGRGLTFLLFIMACLLWKFGFSLAKLIYGGH